MFERFTDRARQVTVLAQAEARRLNHSQIGTEHLLLGLLRERKNVATKVLVSLGVSLEAVRVGVEERSGQGQTAPSGETPFTPAATQALELSLEEANQLQQQYVGTEHLLLGLTREPTSVAAQVLAGLGADHARVRAQVLTVWSGGSQRPAAWGQPNPPPGAEDLRELTDKILYELEDKIAHVRQATAAAVDAEDVDTVAALHDPQLPLPPGPAERDRAGGDVPAALEENQRLQGEVERPRGLFGQHGIDPDAGTAQPP